MTQTSNTLCFEGFGSDIKLEQSANSIEPLYSLNIYCNWRDSNVKQIKVYTRQLAFGSSAGCLKKTEDLISCIILINFRLRFGEGSFGGTVEVNKKA